ncbi:hypothetical protein SAY86_007266 [Trapa natans]|uniref:V-SNARE coiled-coil homology domain-containing protein n=1 Tax=Trapa natans TaxID=22666 RepID=A0AAN7LAK0_TRANT|nr:hypothetical protein SAY86_007266 [Trapa natans]
MMHWYCFSNSCNGLLFLSFLNVLYSQDATLAHLYGVLIRYLCLTFYLFLQVLDPGERIKLLVDMSENLQFQANVFKRQGRSLRRKMWLHKLMVGGAILVTIILLWLFMCGGFKSRWERHDAGILVVCPTSVFQQWAHELHEKVVDEFKLKVLIYNVGNRTKEPLELAKYDVVVTTYVVVILEVPKKSLDFEEKTEEKYEISSEFSGSKRRKENFNVGKEGKESEKNIGSSCWDSDYGALARVGWLRVAGLG